MPFQIKDFVSIVASQINHAKGVTTKITDFQPGSIARTLMEAPAGEVEELYLQTFLGLRDAIPVATFLSFGFDKLPPAYARGYVSISASPAPTADLVVPAGTTFTALDGRTYLSSSDLTWSAGASVVRVPVTCTVVGAVGNAAGGIITSSPFFNGGFTISNPVIATGRDVESDEEREARFAEFVASLSQGTVVACTYAAKQAQIIDADGNASEYVTRAGLLEQAGYVIIYIYSNAGEPSDEILARGQMLIDGARDPMTGAVIETGTRAAGIRFEVLAMNERAVPLAVQVQMLPGHELDEAVEQQMGDIYAAALLEAMPGTVLYLGDLIDGLLEASNVLRVVPVNNSNIVCAVHEVLMPGALTITPL